MEYEFKKTRSNRDGTFNYEVCGKFPVNFRDFYRQILNQSIAFEVEFRATNRCYGGWLGNRLEARNHLERWYWEDCSPRDWLNEITEKEVTSCMAHGSRNHLILYCTFDVSEKDAETFVLPDDEQHPAVFNIA